MDKASEYARQLAVMRINTTQDALKVLPHLIELMKQINMVLARNSRNELFARNAKLVEKKIKDGSMKPINTLPGVEVEVKEEKPIEEPQEVPFEDEEVSEKEKKAAKRKLFGKKEK